MKRSRVEFALSRVAQFLITKSCWVVKSNPTKSPLPGRSAYKNLDHGYGQINTDAKPRGAEFLQKTTRATKTGRGWKRIRLRFLCFLRFKALAVMHFLSALRPGKWGLRRTGCGQIAWCRLRLFAA